MSDLQVMLFVGGPETEALSVLMKELSQEAMITCLHLESLGKNGENIEPVLENSIPDLICLFSDALEDAGEDPLAFCGVPRERAHRYRPVLVVQSTASDEERRIQYLINGADDILNTDIASEEFQIRLLAHLRRTLDIHRNETTKLPDLSFTAKILQRRINVIEPWAIMAIELDHFDVYNEVYGYLPGAQVLKTFAAMMGKLVTLPDFISQSDENTFVIVTRPDKAEKLAAILCRQFETVAPNFYSEKDRKQGYMISVISDNISRRVPLLTLSIGIVSNQNQQFDSFLSAFNAGIQMKNLARMTPGNTWLSDRPRLAGEARGAAKDKPTILVLESDAALAYLLKTTLEMEGYTVDVTSGVEDAREVLQEKKRDLVILDTLLSGQESGLAFCREIRGASQEIGIICTSSLHDRQKVLGAGADLYLPKPFELLTLFSWIARLLKGP